MVKDVEYYEDLEDAEYQKNQTGRDVTLLRIYRQASKYGSQLMEKRKEEGFLVAGRVLAWLGLAQAEDRAELRYEPTSYLLQVMANGLTKERPKSSKLVGSYADVDVIESLLEAALEQDNCAPDLRGFVCNVLGVLGMVRFTEPGEAIPTRFLRKLVGTCRQQERIQRERRKGNETEEGMRNWRAARREAGLRIDPEIAEVFCTYARTLDPYGIRPDLPKECQQIGREYFALSPRSDMWVLFEDLPPATQKALRAKCL
jgi:hypothetical protein